MMRATGLAIGWILCLTSAPYGQNATYSEADRQADVEDNQEQADAFDRFVESTGGYSLQFRCDENVCQSPNDGLSYSFSSRSVRVQLTYAGEIGELEKACVLAMRYLKPELGDQMALRLIQRAVESGRGYTSGRTEIDGLGVAVGEGLEDPILTYCNAWRPEAQ